MGTKGNPGAYDCWANAKPDEPVFVLLGRDRLAASLIDLWALARLKMGEETAVVNNAADVASEMRNYLYLSQKRELRVLQFVPDEVLLAELERRQAMNRIAQSSRQPSDFAPSAPIEFEQTSGTWPANARANGAHVMPDAGAPGEPTESEGGDPV